MTKSDVGKKVTVKKIDEPDKTYLGKIILYKELEDGGFACYITIACESENLIITNKNENDYTVTII